MASAGKNFALFTTDLFVFRQRDEDMDRWSVGGDCAAWFYVRLLLVDHIEPGSEPVMEDWGWTFGVSVDGVEVIVNVWAYFGIENCWLFGVEASQGCFRWKTPERFQEANAIVCDGLEGIIAADARFAKRKWFAENPFDLDVREL